MNEFYTAESTLADNLRLELSIATPLQQEQMSNAAITLRHAIIDAYGNFIQPEALHKTDRISERIVLMSKADFEAFYSEWDNSGNMPDSSIMAVTYQLGDVIVLKDPAEVWHTFTKVAQENLSHQFGDEATARYAVSELCFFDNLTHEIIHQFQDNSLPKLYLEVATRYYQRQITKKLKLGHADNQAMNESITLYERLLDVFGERMHKVFFGAQLDTVYKAEIIQSIISAALGRASLKNL